MGTIGQKHVVKHEGVKNLKYFLKMIDLCFGLAVPNEIIKNLKLLGIGNKFISNSD